ncbi:MAG: hypothetical protein HQM08_21265 [Candidatus Riflebacteria bacterium]|nr:hypothetical protein [Candidatus Riflebacteria bacterium]
MIFSKKFFALFLALFLLVALGSTLQAQAPDNPDKKAIGEAPPPELMKPGNEPPPPGMLRPGKKPLTPEDKDKNEKVMAFMSTAEAYKNLADLNRESGKIDDAVAQLKKILELANAPIFKDDSRVDQHIGHVYMEIAELFIAKDRFSDAEGIIKEGFDKIKTTNPPMASRMMLMLGNSYKKAGKIAEAEGCFKKVIEINADKIGSIAAPEKK